jgi:CRISPR-associated RAMP protein (TIGR02581 family)
MHKQLVNEANFKFIIEPNGPILIKTGGTDADPTFPDMEFVRTRRQGDEKADVYLPGSSLKGILRAQCERIVRTVGSSHAQENGLWSCDPLHSRESCSRKLEPKRDQWAGDKLYCRSCFVCRMFGNTAIAGHTRITDAYPRGEVLIEERYGVAIDRIFGSVAVGPFNLEVVTQGEFEATLLVRNFTLAQLGLLALTLRDLKLGRIGVGFGKSRGLGRVNACFTEFGLRYPTASLQDGNVVLKGGKAHICRADEIAGAGCFPNTNGYGFPRDDAVALPNGLTLGVDEWGEVGLLLTDESDVEQVWAETCVPAWSAVAGLYETEVHNGA